MHRSFHHRNFPHHQHPPFYSPVDHRQADTSMHRSYHHWIHHHHPHPPLPDHYHPHGEQRARFYCLVFESFSSFFYDQTRRIHHRNRAVPYTQRRLVH